MTKKIVGLTLAVAGALAPSAFPQYGGYNGSGKCTVEVEVDQGADVLVTGSSAQIRSLGGGRANVIRTNCNSPMPPAPASFRFRGIDGRGRQTLLAEPASNRGTAVVRIDDPKSGRERYTFDLTWSGNGGYNSGVYGNNGGYGYPSNGYPNGNGYPAGNGYPSGNGYPAGNGYPNGNGYPVYGGNYPNSYPSNGYPSNGYPNNNGYPVYGSNNGTYGNYPPPPPPKHKHRREPRYYDQYGNPVY